MTHRRWRFQLDPESERKRRVIVDLLEAEGGPLPANAGEPFLSTGDVARLLRVNPHTVRRWANTGKLKALFTLGGHRMFPASSVRALLEEHAASKDRRAERSGRPTGRSRRR